MGRRVSKEEFLDYKRCIGCGVCVTKCDKFKAIILQERKIFRPPADNMAEAFARRYFELKGQQDNLLPKLTLGVTRFLSSVNPIHMTGPRAMSFKKDRPALRPRRASGCLRSVGFEIIGSVRSFLS